MSEHPDVVQIDHIRAVTAHDRGLCKRRLYFRSAVAKQVGGHLSVKEVMYVDVVVLRVDVEDIIGIRGKFNRPAAVLEAEHRCLAFRLKTRLAELERLDFLPAVKYGCVKQADEVRDGQNQCGADYHLKDETEGYRRMPEVKEHGEKYVQHGYDDIFCQQPQYRFAQGDGLIPFLSVEQGSAEGDEQQAYEIERQGKLEMPQTVHPKPQCRVKRLVHGYKHE